MAQIKQFAARSVEASRLRVRKYELIRQFGIPENLIAGMSATRRRCGKVNCHCAGGAGHAQWAITLCRDGRKRVEKVPADWVEELEQVVLDTQSYLDAIKEVMAINVELLALTRRQTQEKKRTRREKKRRGGGTHAPKTINNCGP